MKMIYTYSILIITLFINTHTTSAQDRSVLTDKIAKFIIKSNTDSLVCYLNKTVKLNILHNRNTYSKGEAKYILDDFFNKYPPSDFIIKHKGQSKDGSVYAIGTYKSGEGKFRSYYLLKEEKNNFLIHILQFEKY